MAKKFNVTILKVIPPGATFAPFSTTTTSFDGSASPLSTTKLTSRLPAVVSGSYTKRIPPTSGKRPGSAPGATSASPCSIMLINSVGVMVSLTSPLSKRSVALRWPSDTPLFVGDENTISLGSLEPLGSTAEPISVLSPPPFLREMSTLASDVGLSKLAYHKLASAVRSPRFVS